MQYNIYFRKDNWEHFKEEENKSGLINDLLVLHYNTMQGTPTKAPVKESPRVPVVTEASISRAAGSIKEMDKTLTPNEKAEFLGAAYTAGDKAYSGVIKTPEDVTDAIRQVFPEAKVAKRTCKHGNPKGRCYHKEANRLGCNV